MSAVETAEKAIEQLAPEEFEEFLVWLSQRVSARLGSAQLSGGVSSAQVRAEAHASALKTGATEPLRYVDLERLPAPAQRKAKSIVAEWRAQYGS